MLKIILLISVYQGEDMPEGTFLNNHLIDAKTIFFGFYAEKNHIAQFLVQKLFF